MKLVGQVVPSTRSEVIPIWIGLAVVGAFLLPWIAIAIGCIMVGINDVRWVENRKHRGHTRGYLIKFSDGNGIYVCRSLSSSDVLANALNNVVKNRSTTLA